jgi:3-oxoadipate enol-lactonase
MTSAPELSYDVTGPADAPVLVVGPSLGTTFRMWDAQVPALSEAFRVVRYDHLGHGGSAVLPGPYTVDRLAGAVLSLVDDLGVDRFHYAGLSLGGMVGMAIAARVPQRVRRLALLCTSAYLPPAQGWRDRAAAVRAGGTASIAETVTERWFTAGFTGRAPFEEMLVTTPDEGYVACCAAIETMDLRSRLGAITAPTMVIAGAEDVPTPPAHGELIAGAVPGARFEVVADAGHLANVEQPAEITALLLNHLGATT